VGFRCCKSCTSQLLSKFFAFFIKLIICYSSFTVFISKTCSINDDISNRNIWNILDKIIPGVVMLIAPSHFITANKTTIPVVSMGTGGHIASPLSEIVVENCSSCSTM